MSKKLIALALCVIMAIGAFCLTGCAGGEKSYIGKWVSTTCEQNGEEVQTAETWGEMSMEFKEDGTASAVIIGLPAEGTWEYNDESKTINVTTDTFEDFEVTEEDGSLYFDFSDTKVKLDKVEE